MKIIKIGIFGLLLCFLSSLGYAGTLNYNRDEAIVYAKEHCATGTYNTQDANNSKDIAYISFANDCANFVSQAMIKGGLSFGCVKDADVIGRGKKNKGEKGEVTVRDRTEKGKTYKGLLTQLKDNFCFEIITDPSKAQKGDILSSKTSSHVVMYSGEQSYKFISGGKEMTGTELRPAYYGHTEDRCNEATDRWDKWIIYRFQDSDKCKKCELDEKTCKAEMKNKANLCQTCDPATGKLTPECQNVAGGRCGSTVNCDTQTGMCVTSPAGNICADDTFTEGTGFSPGPVPSTSSSATAGILEVGYTYDMYALLQSFNEDARVIRPGDLSPELVKDMSLLIIPSAGLYGMENSVFFKAVLDEYVRQGGNILVLSQQHGQAFSIIPGGLGGYGWVEDQHCQTNSSYIDTWHPVLAGQTRSAPSLNVDGYFTKYPAITTILLRRTINGQPAVLMYPYGSGYVIAATVYTDNAYTRGEASEDERRLIRDIVTWAKSPTSLSEIKQGETATANLTITNNDVSETATAAEIELYDPDRKNVKLRTNVPISLAPGQSTQIPITYTTVATDPVGIYHVEYDLLTEGYQLLTSEQDPEGANVWLEYLLQPPLEEPSGRFVVSKPPASPAKVAQLAFSIQSDAENYAYGSTATFTIIAFNNSDTERTVTAKGEFGSQTLIVPAKGSSSFTYSKTVYGSWWFTASFYNENNTFLSSRSKTYFVHWPSASLDLKTDKTLYAKGETVTIVASLKNYAILSGQYDVKIAITDSSNTKVFEDMKPIYLSSFGTGSAASNFTLPATLSTGTYTVKTEAYYGTVLLSSSSVRFELPQSQISVTQNLTVLTAGSNTVPFVLNNTGKISVYSGTLDVSLKDPDGTVVYTGSQQFAIGAGLNTALSIPLSIPPLKFGKYTLTYSQSDETRTGKPANITVSNQAIIFLSLDKEPYRIRETANLTVELTNIQKFNLDNATLTVSAPGANYNRAETVSLASTQNLISNIVIPLPGTMTAGQHDVNVTLTLPSGSSISRNIRFTVPESLMDVGYAGSNMLAEGDTINLTIKNEGGIDAPYIFYIYLIDSKGSFIDEKTQEGFLLAGEQSSVSYTLPEQLKEDDYKLEIALIDTAAYNSAYRLFPLYVSGLTGSLSVSTDKDAYLTTETTTTMSTIINPDKPIANGNLHLEIICADFKAQTGASFHIYADAVPSSARLKRGILSFPPYFTQKELALSISPDEWGGAFIEIRQEGADAAFLDYIALKDSDGNVYPPSYVVAGEGGPDYTADALDYDGQAANVTGQTFYADWKNLPQNTSLTLVMVAKEDRGCGILWQRDEAVNQGAGSNMNINIPAGIIGQEGKFYLRGVLTNAFGQTIAASEYPFYIVDGNTLILLGSERKFYKPGETVNITGEVKNLAAVTLENAVFTLTSEGNTLIDQTVTIPVNGAYPFTVATSAGTDGVVILRGSVSQNSITLAETADQYEVVNPFLDIFVDAPETAGNEPFPIDIWIRNMGKIDSTVQFTVQGLQFTDQQQVIIPEGETKIVKYRQQINQDTDYTFTFTGDFEETIAKTVSYGLAATITIAQQAAYPEGRIALPVMISNAGQLDATIDTGYRIQDSSNNIIQEQTKTYYIPKGGSTTDTLYYDLTEGSYTLTAEGFPASGNDNPGGQPLATANASFSVKKENNATMAVTVGSQASELIPVTVSLTNNGYNDINGSVQLSVISSAGQTVWNSDQSVSELLPSGAQLLIFNINPSSIEPGNYDLKAELLNNSNQQTAVINQPLTIRGPVFQIAQMPPYQTFMPGQEAVFTFKIKNAGNQEGAFDLHFKAYDLIDSTRREWIKPGEEKSVSFSFFLPDDLEKNDYFADYELNSSSSLNGSKGQIKYHVAGIHLDVNAVLDKQNYREGETAHLTIAVSSQQSAVSQNLFARVNYNGYENQQSFALTSASTLTFDIPLTAITGEKLFYGVYHESGRSIHLNSLYIYKAGDVITITTNKQVYDPGETVSVSVTGNASGAMTMAGPGYSEVFSFSGNAAKSFVLPSAMSAGTYFINAELQTANSGLITASHPVDVSGIQVKVLGCRNDKGKYASTDTIKTDFKISSNRTMPAALKAWIIDPEGRYTSVGEHSINLVSSENILLTFDFSLLTSVSGIHRLVYGIYSEGLLLVSGSEAFDVGDAVLLGISTDKTDYPENTEPVNVTVSMYGTVDAYLELQLDGATVKNESVSLNGFRTLNIELGTVKPGIHVLKGILKAGGLTNTRETRFTYAMSLLDSDGDGMPDEWELAHGLDPNNPADASLDPDNDGLTNLQEYYNRTNPNISDTDNDGMPDEWEVAHRLNPNLNDAASDKDGDGYSNLEEYQKGSDPNDPASIPNQAPVAHAGRDQNVVAGTVVTLDGSESYDPEGAMITFLWGFTEVPAGSTVTNASLSDPTSAKPAFMADVKGTYRAYLIVNDGRLSSAPDEVEIYAAVPNIAPNADAGPDQNAITGGMVVVDGSRSSDPDNWPQPLSYLWSFDLVPPESLLVDEAISGRNQATAGFVLDAGGAYVMRLTVSDGDLASEDSVTILAAAANVPPNADAGSDITVHLGETAVPDASASNDPDNGPFALSYQWRFVAVPAGSQLNNGSIINQETATPSFTPDVTGTYVLELTVSDGQGYGFDNMAVTVLKRAATLCSILGNDPKPSILDQDIFRFTGTKGEQIRILLEATPAGAGSGKRATLLLVDNIAGVWFAREDRTVLPNEITVKLPATGEYLVTVAEQPLILPGERYRGAYCLTLEASPKTLQSFSPAFWVE